MRKRKYIHEPVTVVEPKTGLPFDDYPPRAVYLSAKSLKPKNRELSDCLDEEAEDSATALGLALLVGLAVLAIAVFGLIGFAVKFLIGGAC